MFISSRKIDIYFSKIRLSCLVIIHIFFYCLPVISQDDNSNVLSETTIELGGHYGKMMEIFMNFPETGKAFAYDLTFGINTKGSKYWHQFYNYPTIDLTLSFSDFSNKNVLGYGISFYTGLSARKQLLKNLYLKYKAAAGLAYCTNPYDALDNPTNSVFGSYFMPTASFALLLENDISDNFSVFSGGSFRHFSNGHSKVPNVGANLYYLNFGFKYKTDQIEKKERIEEQVISKKWLYKFNVGLGTHAVEGTGIPSGGPSYPVYFGSFSIAKRLTYKNQLEFGLNYAYYTDYYDFIINQQIFFEKERIRSSKAVVFIGHEHFLGRLSFAFSLGANVYFPYRHRLVQLGILDDRFMDNYLTAKIGFNYYFKDLLSSSRIHPYLGTAIRSIGGKADFFELSTGVAF